MRGTVRVLTYEDLRDLPEFEYHNGLLLPENISERGEVIPSVGAQVVWFDGLEKVKLNVPLDDIIAYPDQPRIYFDEQEMANLVNSIRVAGQSTPIQGVPLLFSDGRMAFLSIDGERRKRAKVILRDSTAIMAFKKLLTEEEIFRESLILNETRDDHNPIERARAYDRLIRWKEQRMGRSDAVAATAGELGVAAVTVYRYLELLKLEPEVQEMVMKGTLPLQRALAYKRVREQFGGSYDQVAAARQMVDGLHRPESDGVAETSFKGVTLAARERRMQIALGEGGADPVLDARIEAQLALKRLNAGLSNVIRGAESMFEAEEWAAIEFLRSRPLSPPDVVRDKVRRAIEILLRLDAALLDTAILKDPLPTLEGKPKYVDYVRENRDSFGVSGDRGFHRADMAMILAEEADDGGRLCFMAADIAERLGVDVGVVTSNIWRLRKELREIGLVLRGLSTAVKRVRKSGKAGYEQVPAYRIGWKELFDEGKTERRPDLEEGLGGGVIVCEMDEQTFRERVGVAAGQEGDVESEPGVEFEPEPELELELEPESEPESEPEPEAEGSEPDWDEAGTEAQGEEGNVYQQVLEKLDGICGGSLLLKQVLGFVCEVDGRSYDVVKGRFAILDDVMERLNVGRLRKLGFKIFVDDGMVKLGVLDEEPESGESGVEGEEGSEPELESGLDEWDELAGEIGIGDDEEDEGGPGPEPEPKRVVSRKDRMAAIRAAAGKLGGSVEPKPEPKPDPSQVGTSCDPTGGRRREAAREGKAPRRFVISPHSRYAGVLGGVLLEEVPVMDPNYRREAAVWQVRMKGLVLVRYEKNGRIMYRGLSERDLDSA